MEGEGWKEMKIEGEGQKDIEMGGEGGKIWKWKEMVREWKEKVERHGNGRRWLENGRRRWKDMQMEGEGWNHMEIEEERSKNMEMEEEV